MSHGPTLVHEIRHGGNPVVASLHRPDQSERFGLKLIRLVLPVEGHRIGALSSLSEDFERSAPSQLEEGPPQALGLLSTVGFAALLFLGLAAAVRPPGTASDPVLQAAAGATLASVVIAVAGGGALLVSYLVSDWIRSWNRFSIFIAFFAIVAVATGLDRAGAALAARGISRPLRAAALAAVLVLAVLDQTSARMVPDYDRLARRWHDDRAFVTNVAARLPPGSPVYELPYYPFPEINYELAMPSLHTDRLRWSFGAMAGRPADWAAGLSGLPGPTTLASVAAAGFAGVYLDGSLYPDHGVAVKRDLRALLGAPGLSTEDGRLTFFDIRSFAADVRQRLGPRRGKQLAFLTLHPVGLVFGPEFGPLQTTGPPSISGARPANSPSGRLELVNPLGRPRAVTLRFGIRSPHSATFRVRLATADGRVRSRLVPPGGTRVELPLTLRPGRNRLQILTDLERDDTAVDAYFAVSVATVEDAVATGLAEAGLRR